MTQIVVISHVTEAAALTRWAYHFAQAQGDRLLILVAEEAKETSQVDLPPQQQGTSSCPRHPILGQVCETLQSLKLHPLLHHDAYYDQDALPQGEALAPPELVVRHLKAPDRLAAVLAQIDQTQTRMLLVGKHESSKNVDPATMLPQRLFESAPCATMLMRPGGGDGRYCDHILLPTGGGPNAAAAMHLLGRFVKVHGGILTPLFVEPLAGELASDVGLHVLDTYLKAAGLEADGMIQPKVVLADNVFSGIAEAATEEYDLVVLGASHMGTLRRTLFGTIPDRMLSGERDSKGGGSGGGGKASMPKGMAVAVMRAPKPLAARLRERLERLFDRMVPQLAREHRIRLVETLQNSSTWSFDFMALIALSTSIAALGLLQSSAAVVIGAMLVAPLMSPLLGAGLALVHGNMPLIKNAVKSIVFGFFTALAIGFLTGLVVRIPELTPELAARGGPTLLDMGIALLSGVAAAYCLGRPNLSAALPGVAIAAALVPPIATAGISLSMGEAENALGAALLFSTNVVAIILGASLSFFAVGVRANPNRSRAYRWVRRTLIGLILAAAVMAIPLSSLLISHLTPPRTVSTQIPAEARDAISRRIEAGTTDRVLRLAVSEEADVTILTITIASDHLPERALAEELAALVEPHVKGPVRVRLATELVYEVRVRE